ncbi:MAG: peptide-methionine (R)-S-oxide reductase MsrB [Candidatus Woykebacteria bacterium]
MKKISKSDAELKRKLDPQLYHIAFEKGTEAPFSKTLDPAKDGIYRCNVCGNELFSEEAKFESGTGWPSFYGPITPSAVEYAQDKSLGISRTEITCGKCGAHLGHVFDDGPKTLPGGKQATGKRYCVNCVSLNPNKEK